MLKRYWDKKICDEYILKGDVHCDEYNEKGDAHCHECPLRLPEIDPYYACMANCHWDDEREEWVIDD